MLSFIVKTLTKVLGNKSVRDLKTIVPYVALINEEHARLIAISDDQLREKTPWLKAEIQKESDLDREVNQMLDQLERTNAGEFQRFKMYPILKQKLAKEKKVIL